LHLTGNFRVDKIAFGPVDFPVQYSFRAAVAYRWNANWVTKLIGGRAFQTPSGEMLFGHPGFGNANNIIGNVTIPDQAPLRPQSVNNVELVASGQFLERFSIDVAFYFQDLVDEIQFVQTGLNFTAVNQGQRVSVGLESTLRFQYRWLSLYGSGSIDAPLMDNKFVSQPTALYPRGLGVVGLDVDIRRIYLHANTQVRIVGPRGASQSNVYLNNSQPYELPTYAIFDLTLSTAGFHLFGADAETKVLVSGRNLADQSTPEPGFAGIDLPRIGRSFFFELRQTF
jgi:iron complex outermembrane receptor protein